MRNKQMRYPIIRPDLWLLFWYGKKILSIKHMLFSVASQSFFLSVRSFSQVVARKKLTYSLIDNQSIVDWVLYFSSINREKEIWKEEPKFLLGIFFFILTVGISSAFSPLSLRKPSSSFLWTTSFSKESPRFSLREAALCETTWWWGTINQYILEVFML